MKKDCTYNLAKENIYGKDKRIFNFCSDMLTKANEMFHWENLPKETPKRIMEKYLTESGYCIFTKEGERFVLLQGGLGGELNEYYEPTKCIVANPYLKLNKEYTINDDCVLIRNDARQRGLLPILTKYAVLVGDCELSLNMLTNILRAQFLISAGDDKTKESADKFIQDLINGKFAAVGNNAFLDDIKLHSLQGNGNYINQFIELTQYLRATAFNEIGLDANYNMKRERLTENEVDLNAGILLPLAENMLEERKNACELINEKYGLSVSVELSSVWKLRKETMEKATETEETETQEEKREEAREEKETETQEEKETETQEEKETETQEEKREGEEKNESNN